MIIQFLRLFPQFIAVEGKVTELSLRESALRRDLSLANAEISAVTGQSESWKARYEAAEENVRFTRDQLRKAEQRIEETERDYREKLTTAVDSLSLRATGRRLLSKAPVEAPPSEEQAPRAPINLSRRFAGDVARQNTRDFFKQQAIRSGVLPQSEPTDNQQPN